MRLGGVSDPRNGLIMKMFSLIDVGERAGTGVPDVFATWANAGLPEPRSEEKFGEADRTILTLMLESDAKSAHNEQILSLIHISSRVSTATTSRTSGSPTATCSMSS